MDFAELLASDGRTGTVLRDLLMNGVGVSEATVSRWKSGDQVPRDSQVAAIAAAIQKDEQEVADAVRTSRVQRETASPGPKGKPVTRSEFNRLKQRVDDLTTRLDQISPSTD